VAQLYTRALGSLFVASYDSQDCDGGNLTPLHTGFVHQVVYFAIYKIHDKITHILEARKERRIQDLLSKFSVMLLLRLKGTGNVTVSCFSTIDICLNLKYLC
jgi:hypothetical protein